MNELRNSKSDDQLEELLLLTEQMQEELDQKDRTIRELKMQLDESLTLNERLNSENRAGNIQALDLIEAEDIREIFDEIESSPVMETLWKTYQKNYSYAADISWHAIVKSICALYGSILENMYDT